MLQESPCTHSRYPHTETIDSDLVVVGGGLAGTCAAVTAARTGLKVTLIQDRPVLGGNSSSEVRLWVLGATAHGHNNNRWAREGGIVNEILLENQRRNPEGNALLYDAVLLDLVLAEPNIRLLLNTAVYECEKDTSDPNRIAAATAFCSQNSTRYIARAPLFCDASGDGILAFMAGAAFRMGAEAKDEFDEAFAPDESYGSLLGHSIYFYSKDAGRPVQYTSPRFAMSIEDIETKIPRYRNFRSSVHGCQLWWIEYGGRLDTVYETETIKWELWRIVYGVWNYIKNSGKFPDAENLTLEWVGHIPGKRESRRFEGDAMLVQQDVIEQRRHEDDVAFGGWSIDLHPADGVYSERSGCTQWHAKGIYPIPYRVMYSRNVENLFLAGRILSASHVAFGSSRVMGTLGCCAMAVGMAASLCKREGVLPRDIASGKLLRELQLELTRAGQHIPSLRLTDPRELAQQATITGSSELQLAELPADGPAIDWDSGKAQMLPVAAGPMPKVSLMLDVAADTEIDFELRQCTKPAHHTPDVTLATRRISLKAGQGQWVALDFGVEIDQPRYVWIVVSRNKQVAVRSSKTLLTGVLSVHHRTTQQPPEGIGVETFEFWAPWRRPHPQNFAMRIDPPLQAFAADQVRSGVARPTNTTHAWVADPTDPNPRLTMRWDQPIALNRIVLTFDADWDHPMESVLMGHPDRNMPMCVRHYRLLDGDGRVLHEETDNYQARRDIHLSEPVALCELSIDCLASHGPCPAAIFEVRCYTP